MANIKRRNLFFAIVFFLSGISGLIYESIWTKYLKLFLGHAAYAQAQVLIVFMAGMSLGSWLVGQRAETIKNPLRVYAAIELLIGVFALSFDRGYAFITSLMYESWLPALGSSTASYTLTWGIAGLMILAPAVLLGATFPLMSNGVTRLQPGQSGRVIASLYFVNSLGGAIGVLFNSFFLVEWLGLPGAMLMAGAINIVLACLVWLATADYQAVTQAVRISDGKNDTAWTILLIAGLTGCASFMYEIGWIRMLSMVLGSSTHSFELMLSAFITGLAFGGWWVKHRIDKLHSSMHFLAFVQLLMGSAAILSLWAYSQTFDVIAWVFATVQRNQHGYQVYTLVSHLLAFLLMLPATFCAGMTLPLITYSLFKSGYGERAVGQVYSANTIGSILGVLLAIHLLLPVLGLKWVLMTGAIIDISLGIWLLKLSQDKTNKLLSYCVVAGSVLLAIFSIAQFQLDTARMASGVFLVGDPKLNQEDRVLRVLDGKTATINLRETSSGTRLIATNGKPDAALFLNSEKVTADEFTMALLGSLGFAHHDAPETIAAIGMGSGMTSHFVLSSNLPKRLDTIEIEPAMVELARAGFAQRVSKTFNDTRSNIVIEDAKTYFAIGNKKYDLIISEPSNPWVSGVSSLFTREFYRHLARHLNRDGVLVQWVQAYDTDVQIVASIVKALRTEFKDYAIYFANQGDLIIVATKQDQLKYQYSKMFTAPELRRELEHVFIKNEHDLKIRLLGSKATLDNYFSAFSAPINSDYFPYIDIHAARLRYSASNAQSLINIIATDFPAIRYLHSQAKDLDFAQVTPTIFFNRSLKARQNRKFIDWYLHGKSTESIDELQAVHYYLMAEKECSSQFKPMLRSFYSIALLGLSIQDKALREKYWEKLSQVSCYQTVSEMQKLLALFKASAESDFKTMAALGHDLLDHRAWQLSNEAWAMFPLKALLIAEYMQAKPHQLIQSWQSYVLAHQLNTSNLPDLQILFWQAQLQLAAN